MASKKGGAARYYKRIGLGFKTPQEAQTGAYIDKKCPFTSKARPAGTGSAAFRLVKMCPLSIAFSVIAIFACSF